MNSPATFGTADADQRRWHLPADVSGFVGRGDELARLAHLLGRARLVTVAGPGGVGKTRLALRAASAPQAGSADTGTGSAQATCLIELSGLTSPELLLDTVARRLNPQPPETASQLDAVIDELRGRKLLLILDTCEHLTVACAQFAATVLRETSDVTILATSRQPLHVAGEQVLRLQPLPVARSDAAAVADAGDAVELFTQRAAAAVSGFTLSEADLPHVIRLCRRLDGIPLAIELAAVRVRALPIAELAVRVDAGLATSIGSRRGSTGRHQTLHAASDWSYQLCTDAEKVAWRRLSVFAGTFDAAVAADVIALSFPAGAGSPGDGACPEVAATARQAAAVLGGLVDKSVVLPAGAGRYRLLDTVREYGATRLAEAGEEAACRERHLIKYQSLTSDFSRRVIADGQRDRLGQLRAEHENIRGALGYGLAGPGAGSDGDAEAAARMRAAARLAAALFPYWIMSGATREGMRWQQKALARFEGPSSERASALANLALLGTAVGAAETVAQASEAVAVSARVGDERAHARAYLALQFALTAAGRLQEALEAAKQARWRLEKVGADHALRALDLQLGLTYVHAGNFDAAIEQCRRLLRSLAPGERWLRGNAHALCALAYYHQPGRRADCVTMVRMALPETHEIGNLVGEACSLEVLGWLAADAGRCQRAALLLGAAQALWERVGGKLSGITALERHHQRSAATAVGALGTVRFAELHAAGATRALTEITALALTDADVLPEPAGDLSPADPGDDWTGSEVLTSREREIAVLVGGGLSNREIAARLFISKRTVDAHVNHIFGKLGLTSRVQLAIWLRDRATGRPGDALSPAADAAVPATHGS